MTSRTRYPRPRVSVCSLPSQLLAEYLKKPNARKTEKRRKLSPLYRTIFRGILLYSHSKTTELLKDGFGEKPCYHVIVAELTDEESPVKLAPNPDLPSSKMPHNDKIIGHALYYYAYSSWEGKVLYVEDLFVREEYRSTFHTYVFDCTCISLEFLSNA